MIHSSLPPAPSSPRDVTNQVERKIKVGNQAVDDVMISESVKSSTNVVDSTSASLSAIYLFFCRSDTEVRCKYSLWKMDIPDFSASKEASSLMLPSQVLDFAPSEFPHDMLCIHFNSKFYFLGGSIFYFDDLKRRTLIKYPRGVQIYDPLNPLKITVHGPQMRSGKFLPVYFVANSKLYVVGRYLGPKKAEEEEKNDCPMKYCEVFDPRSDQWTEFDDPPFGNNKRTFGEIRWIGCKVISDKVVFVGTREYYLVFDLKTEKWSSLPSLMGIAYENFLIFITRSTFINEYIYGMQNAINGPVMKLGTLLNLDDIRSLSLKMPPRRYDYIPNDFSDDEMSSDEELANDPIDIGDSCLKLPPTNPDFTFHYNGYTDEELVAKAIASYDGDFALQYLGDMQFLLIQTGTFVRDLPQHPCLSCGCSCKARVNVQMGRFFKLKVYDDISNDSDDYKLRCLYDLEPILSLEDFPLGKLLSVHMVNTEERKKKKMKIDHEEFNG